MPIVAGDLASDLRFALDAEGADHYDNNLDIIPAINLAQSWLVNVINRTMGQRKLGEEVLRELTYSDVFLTTKDSRVSIAAFPWRVWSILAVYPKPNVSDDSIILPADNLTSVHLNDIYHVDGDYSAKRLTIEEWSFNKKNPFEAGSESGTSCDELNGYAYLSQFQYNEKGGGQPRWAIEVRPKLNQEKVTIFYVKKPADVTTLGSVIEFPESIRTLLFNKALQYISYKQGDQTNLHSVSQNDIGLLLNSIL